MRRMKPVALSVALGLLCAGCSVYNLEKLRNATPVGTPFQTLLSEEYMDFAAEKEQRYDWGNSAYFAGKGLQAAYGKDTPPENLADWDIPKDKLPELEKARAALVAALTPEATQQSPDIAAMAQVYFDCWVEYQEANWQEDDIRYCRDNFTDSLAALTAPETEKPAAPKHAKHAAQHAKTKPEKTSAAKKPTLLGEKPAASFSPPPVVEEKPTPAEEKPLPPETDAAPPSEPAKSEGKPAAEPQPGSPAAAVAKTADIASYVVLFKAGDTVVPVDGRNVLNDIIHSLLAGGSYEVVLKNGSTAAGGDAAFKQRAEAVKAYLESGGIKDDAIYLENVAPAASPGKIAVAKHVDIFLND